MLLFSDGAIRVFTSAAEREAPAEEQQAFLDSLAASTIPSQIGDVKTEDVPGPEVLMNPGTAKNESKANSHVYECCLTKNSCKPCELFSGREGRGVKASLSLL